MVGDASHQARLESTITPKAEMEVGPQAEAGGKAAGTGGVSSIIQPYAPRYRQILDKRARLTHLLKRLASQSVRISYQERIDDLSIEMEELEGRIACAICSVLDQLVEAYLPAAISHYLARSRARGIRLPRRPLSREQIRRILYRMHSGGSFYPLLFVRDLELELYRVIGEDIASSGMRGREIAGRARRMAIRNRINLRRTILDALNNQDGVEAVGYVPWVWRRDSVSRRAAFAPSRLLDQAREVAAVLEEAVERRRLALRPPRALRPHRP